MVENMAARGHGQFSHVYIAHTLKKILSETARSRALIFGIVYYLMDRYQFCSNNGPGASNKQRAKMETL